MLADRRAEGEAGARPARVVVTARPGPDATPLR